jgi:integration host factor subunit beta
VNRSDLVIRLSSLSGMSLRKAEEVVDMILTQMSDTLASGQRIEIRGFGSFDLSYRPPRVARNPRSGETFPMHGKYFPCFKAGKYLRESLRPASSSSTQSAATLPSTRSTTRRHNS